MNSKSLFFLCLILACSAPAGEDAARDAKGKPQISEIPAFSGNWKWDESKEGRHIFELVLEQKDTIVEGYICAIVETEDGQRIDCGYSDGYAEYNLSGPIKNNVIQANITGAYSRQSGKAMVIHNGDHLRWTILEYPGREYMSDYFFPNEAVLLPDDRKALRNIPYRRDYTWEKQDKQNDSFFSGKWMLTNVLDSTLLQKKVLSFLSFSENPYVHFMTVLDFSTLSNGKLRIVSTIEDGLVSIEEVNANTLAFEFDAYQYRLTKESDKLLKLTVFQQNTTKPIGRYYYRHTFEPLLELAHNEMGLYFNRVLEGAYRIAGEKNKGGEVRFGSNWGVRGLSDYDSYRIHWNLEPGTPEVDAVELINTPGDEYQFYHFRFEGNTLFLYHLKKTADPESGFYEYEIADEFLQLKPIQ